MPYHDDGIPKINSYSLTDLHDFGRCTFLFYVRHHLDKKYEIDSSNEAIALGHILDQTIKRFHKEECYGTKSSQRLVRLVQDSVREMKRQVAEAQYKGKNHFYESSVPFFTEEVIQKAIQVFTDYYVERKGKINKSIGEIGFCQRIIHCKKGIFKIWGGADTLEMGGDGMPEVVDYKSRQNIEKGKYELDMDLMPKIYVLLCADILLKKGYKKARFRARFWQDPNEENYYDEFDLEELKALEEVFDGKVCDIVDNKEILFCENRFCRACQSPKRELYVGEISGKFGLTPFLKDSLIITDTVGASSLMIEPLEP